MIIITKIQLWLFIVESNVEISDFNIKGQRVNTLTNEFYQKGDHKVSWNGADELNKSVSPGVFFCRVEAGNKSTTKKLLLLK